MSSTEAQVTTPKGLGTLFAGVNQIPGHQIFPKLVPVPAAQEQAVQFTLPFAAARIGVWNQTGYNVYVSATGPIASPTQYDLVAPGQPFAIWTLATSGATTVSVYIEISGTPPSGALGNLIFFATEDGGTPWDFRILPTYLGAQPFTTNPVRFARLTSQAVAAATPILAGNYVAPSVGTVNVLVALQAGATSTTFSVTLDGTHYDAIQSVSNLTLGALYVFGLPVDEGDEVNFEVGAATTLDALRAFFVPSQ